MLKLIMVLVMVKQMLQFTFFQIVFGTEPKYKFEYLFIAYDRQ